MQAMKTLFYVPRFRGQTILHPLKAKYGRVLLSAWPKSSHGGIKANNLMASICRLAGIVNIGIKVGLRCVESALCAPGRPACARTALAVLDIHGPDPAVEQSKCTPIAVGSCVWPPALLLLMVLQLQTLESTVDETHSSVWLVR